MTSETENASASSATVNGIARLEQPQNLLHPLVLRETGVSTSARRCGATLRRRFTDDVKTVNRLSKRCESKVDSQSGANASDCRHDRDDCSSGSPARDRDAIVGLRQLRHALPRLPVAGRGAERPGADRRRRARPPADRCCPTRRAAHPVGRASTTGPSSGASRRSRGSGSAQSTRTSSATTTIGSAASATPTRGARRRRSSTAASASRSRAGRLDDVSLWLADGTNYPGQDDLRGRYARLVEGSSRSTRAADGHAPARRVQVLRARLLQHRPPRLGHGGNRSAGGSGRRRRCSSTRATTRRGRTSSRSSRSCSPRGCSAASTSTTASTPTTT